MHHHHQIESYGVGTVNGLTIVWLSDDDVLSMLYFVFTAPTTATKKKKDSQSWTALFRAFSSHRQPSASLTKLFPS